MRNSVYADPFPLHTQPTFWTLRAQQRNRRIERRKKNEQADRQIERKTDRKKKK